MKINRQEASPKFPIWELSVPNVPFDRDFFDSNIWTSNKLVDGEYISYGEERKEYKEGTVPEFEDWINKFKQDNDILGHISELLELEENKGHFYKLFPLEDKGITPTDFIRRRCDVLYRLINDEPGYKMHNHFDNRSVLGNIFINLTDNKGVATTFVNTFTNGNHSVLDNQTNIHYKGPEEKNKGIFFLNSSDTYHGIHNNSEKTRYIMNILIYFPDLTF